VGKLLRIRENIDRLNTPFQYIEGKDSERFSIEICDYAEFAVYCANRRTKSFGTSLFRAPKIARDTLSAPIDLIWHSNRLASAIGVENDIARKQIDQALHISIACSRKKAFQQVILFSCR